MFMLRIALASVLILLGACTSWQSKPVSVPAEAASRTPNLPASEPAEPTQASAPTEASTAAVSSPKTASDTPAPVVLATPTSAPEPVKPVVAVKPTTPRPQPLAEPESTPIREAAPAPIREAAKPKTTAPKTVRTTPARTKPAPKPVPTAEPAPISAANVAAINGRISLTGGRGQQVDASDIRDTVVYFVPDSRRARPAAGHFNVYTHNRDFSPAAMVVPVGSTVAFTNLDEIRHNVFSVTPGSSFDLGYQGNGESDTVTFDKPGVVLAGCNVHRGMHAEVLVLGSRYATRVDANGSYTLKQVPAVPGTLYFWHPRAQLGHQPVRPPFSPNTQDLIALKPAVPVEIHLAKQP